MPLQNRVRPDGVIEAVSARGTVMGNRGGCFHRPDQSLKRRQWATSQWICCELSFKGRRRRVFSPGLYTELFFLDEATALAAGHRPCFECRRAEAVRFAEAWALSDRASAPPRAPQMDGVLHEQRLASSGMLPIRRARLCALPDGAFVRAERDLWLVWARRLHRWTHQGYEAPCGFDGSLEAEVVTPWSIVGALKAGYRPALHSSVAQLASPPKRPMSSE